MSNFTFLQLEGSDLHQAANKAEALAHTETQAAQRASLVGLGALFACLQHRAFRGEL